MIILCLGLLFSCSRAEIKNKKEAMRRVNDLELSDDLELESFLTGLQENIDYLEKNELNFLDFNFAGDVYTKEEYIKGLRSILLFHQKFESKDILLKYIQRNFNFYEVYGADDYGEILLTSYYGPLIKGSLTPNPPYTRPLYRPPNDLVEIKLTEFPKEQYGLEFANKKVLYGRLSKILSKQGNIKIVAHYSREEIDQDHALQGEQLEIAFVDPIDAFFLHIQGSGTIELPNGNLLHLGYAGQNGRVYEPIGKFLTDTIPLEEMSLQKIESYLGSLPYKDMQDILNKNPSYVFYKKLDGRPITTLGTKVIDGRTIATDINYFPKGALAFLKFERPLFSDESPTPVGSNEVSRFVFDQDTGGAIKGTGRADLFWGIGDEAKKNAGHIKELAKLYYIAPKK